MSILNSVGRFAGKYAKAINAKTAISMVDSTLKGGVRAWRGTGASGLMKASRMKRMGSWASAAGKEFGGYFGGGSMKQNAARIGTAAALPFAGAGAWKAQSMMNDMIMHGPGVLTGRGFSTRSGRPKPKGTLGYGIMMGNR